MWRLSEKCEDRWLLMLMWSAETLVALFGATQFWSLACWWHHPSLPNKMGIFFYTSLSLTRWNLIVLWKGPNTSNTKLISASENYSRRDIGQNLLFILLFGSELRFGICKICNANPSFSICMGNRHVWNLAASLMCCPMVIYDSTPLSAPSHVYAIAFVFVF